MTKRSERANATQTVEKETERRASCEMVDAHLPEIKILLDRLRKDEPKQYTIAIRNLSQVVASATIGQKAR